VKFLRATRHFRKVRRPPRASAIHVEADLQPASLNVTCRNLKSHLASVAFPAWCLGRKPGAQILCVSYAQELADKLSRDCRRVVASDWYRKIFPTRLSAQRQAVPEFETTAQAAASPPRSAGC